MTVLRTQGAWMVVVAMLTVCPAVARAELIDNGDGTITDTFSGLMWLKNANMNGAMTQAQALAWASSLNVGQHTDWRLPSGANADGTVCNSAPTGANCTGTEFATLYFAQLIMAGNAGPFTNLQFGSYWTATDLPGNPATAMAQDFIDGGQNPFNKNTPLLGWAVRNAGPIPAGSPVLYGIIGTGTAAGLLVQIDTASVQVARVGPTGFPQACGLTADRARLRMYLSPCFGTVGLQAVDLGTGAATPLGTEGTGVRSIAHRSANDAIYGVDISPALLKLDTTTGGESVQIIGAINKTSVGGIAVRQSDGRVFGIGLSGPGAQQLFTLRTSPGTGFADTNIASVSGNPIGGLTFHPDGTLFGTSGTNLLVINPTTGAVTNRGPYQFPAGVPSGRILTIAAMGPQVPGPPDVWLRDCSSDTGTTSSSCSDWSHSPDIFVDNNGDGIRDAIVVGSTNIVRIRVRNRGIFSGPRTVVRLSLLTAASLATMSTPTSLTLIGQRTGTVAPGAVRTAAIPWSAPPPPTPGRGGLAPVQCLAVIFDNSLDRVKSTPDVRLDNNKAVWCR